MNAHNKTITQLYTKQSPMPLVRVLLLFLLSGPSLAGATALSTTVAATAAGEVREVTGTNLAASHVQSPCNGGHNIFEYADKAAWDHRRKQLRFVGQGHLALAKDLTYDDATNTFASVSPSWAVCGAFRHSYQHNTLDPYSGKFYYKEYGANGIILKANIGSTTWTTSAAVGGAAAGCCDQLEYFPEFIGAGSTSGAGAIIFPTLENGNAWSVWAYKDDSSSGTWTRLTDASYNAGNYQGVAVYNPVLKVLVFGGGNGNTQLYMLSRTGEVTALTPAPSGINVSQTLFTVDPVSGLYFLFAATGTVYTLDLRTSATGAWTALPGKSGAFWPFWQRTGSSNAWFGIVAVPLTSYGAIGFLVCGGTPSDNQGCSTDAPRFYVYKHQVPTPFDTKRMDAGVLYYEGFDYNRERLKYNWDTADTGCNNAGLGTRYTWSYPGNTGGNATCHSNSLGTPQYQFIDTSQFHTGVGSLRSDHLTQSGTDPGSFQEGFRQLSTGQWACVSPSPACAAFGNVVYIQWYQRFNAAKVTTNVQCTTGPDSCGGYKQAIWHAEPPYSTASQVTVVNNDGWQRGVPQLYTYRNGSTEDLGNVNAFSGCPYIGSGFNTRPTYAANSGCAQFPANVWVEYTLKITVNGTPNSNSPTSLVEEWVNGVKHIDAANSTFCWGCADGNGTPGAAGNGFGSFEITQYYTNKDPAFSHSTFTMWTDDLIVSTNPIAMSGGSGGGATTPPAAPTNLRVQ